MPDDTPSVLSTGDPPRQLNRCGLLSCRNRGAFGAPSRIWKPPPESRSSENLFCCPQCTQSRSPSADRFTSDGTAARSMTTSCGGRVLLLGGGSAGRVVDGDADDGSLGIGMTA